MTPIARAAAVFVAANVLHTLDHLRQGLGGLTPEILTAGTLLTLAAIAVLALALRGDPRAAVVGCGVGVSGALGIAAAHLAPHWGALSNPYPEIGADALSWAVMLAEIAAAFALAVVGMREVARQPAV